MGTANEARKNAEQVAPYADMFSAMGTEPRLRIMQLLLPAHPGGVIVGEIQDKLGIPGWTLSHHLEKLKNEGLVHVRRQSTFLWCSANTEALRELLGFLIRGVHCGALHDHEYTTTISQAGFEGVSIEPTRIYGMNDARQFLAGQGLDVDVIAPQAAGKFMSAFIRAEKPKVCCGPACCA